MFPGVAEAMELADKGVVFRHAYSHAPYTWGSIASLFASRYPAEAALSNGVLRSQWPLLSEILGRSGWLNGGFTSNPFLSIPFGYARGFAIFDDSLLKNNARWVPRYFYPCLSKLRRAVSTHPYLPAKSINLRVFKWLQEIHNEKLFLWVHYMDTHGPYHCRNGLSYVQKWRAERLWHQADQYPHRISPEQKVALSEAYIAEVEYTFEHIGNLLDHLRRKGFLEGSLVIVTSDHGDAFGEHGTYSHPRQLYDELIHIPLIFCHPDLPAQEINHPVGLIDIMPTILDMLGLDLSAHDFRGFSLIPLMETGDASYLRDYVISDGKPDESETLVSIRTGRWKLIIDEAKDGKELYDLENDPEEKVNMIEHHPAIAQELEFKLWTDLSQRTSEPTKEFDVPEWDAAEKREILARMRALGYVDWVEEHRKKST
jgi:arylsulfatase